MSDTAKPSVIAFVGPTASGKTALAVRLAEHWGADVISADSMQFYRHMPIGTGAPSDDEIRRARHHFVGFLDPCDYFSAGAYEMAARQVVAGLHAAGKRAVVAGGSGLYVRALLDGLFRGPAKNDAIRAQLHAEAAESGVEMLYARLRAVDPGYADVIHANDLRRIVRALEVREIAGVPLSELHRRHRAAKNAIEARQFALDLPRAELYARIDARVDRMLEQGLLDEVRFLLDNGYACAIEQLRSLGYREMAAHLRGELAIEQAAERMKQNTRRFAKRQLAWFRADKRIHWIKAGEGRTEDDLFQELLANI